ncbi:MAG: alpha/beta hydrolase-fold protein [Candidatus Hydrogenedentes bacterium]|nr:alpha/beta hydrolase-fold protein [Candidatus Hydrogenedentota bacterium]
MSIAEEPTGFINKTLNAGGREIPCSVYVPRDYDATKKYPLIVFLHGMGERGDDGLIQSEVGIGRAIRRNPDRFPCIVAMPQCPKDSMWHERFDVIDAAFAQSVAEYSIDESRLYLTGLSMGGYGAWLYGAKNPDKIAALLPICGGGRVADAPALAKLPIWAFHGAADSVVKPEMSRSMVDAIKKAGGNVQYTEYPDVNHNSWDQTYGDEKVIAWLLAQKK